MGCCGLLPLCKAELHVPIQEVALPVAAQDWVFVSLGLVTFDGTFESRQLEVIWQLAVGLRLVPESGGAFSDD